MTGRRMALAGLVLLAACSKAPGPARDHLDRARAFLEAGDDLSAAVEYRTVVGPGGLDPRSCEGNWGLALTLLFHLASDVLTGGRDLLPFVNLQTPGLAPRAGDVDAVVTNFMIPMEQQYLDPAEQALEVVLAEPCSFHTSGIPLALGGDPLRRIWIGRIFHPHDAALLGAGLASFRAALDVVLAHDLGFDMDSVLRAFPDVPGVLDAFGADPIGVLRRLGVFMTTSNRFLTFRPERQWRIGRVPQWIALATQRTALALRELFVTPDVTDPSEASQSVTAWTDANGDGSPDTGDDFWLGVVRSDPPLPTITSPVTIAFRRLPLDVGRGDAGSAVQLGFWLEFSGSHPAQMASLMDRIAGLVSGSVPGLFNLAELNGLLPGSFPFFPDTIAVDLPVLFPSNPGQATPLRRWVAAWGVYNPPGDDGTPLSQAHPIALIEGEVGAKAPPSAWKEEVASNPATVDCYTCGPGPHFSTQVYGLDAGLFSLDPEVAQAVGVSAPAPLPDDCVQITSAGGTQSIQGVQVPLYYVWWQDPTFGGSVYVNLESLRQPGGPCDATDALYSSTAWSAATTSWPALPNLAATRYSLNKAVDAWLVGSLSLLSFSP